MTRHLALGVLAGVGAAAGLAVAAQPAGPSGRQLYENNCAICHAPGWDRPGYNRLRERGVAEPDLSARRDLTRDYVQIVVRRGLGSMPAFLPTRLSDADLASVAGYLSRQE